MKDPIQRGPNASLASTSLTGMDGTMAVSSNNGEAAALPATGYPERMIPAQAASYLGVAEETLAIWRCTKRYSLSYIKVGRLVQYRKSDLDAFLAARTVEASRDA